MSEELSEKQKEEMDARTRVVERSLYLETKILELIKQESPNGYAVESVMAALELAKQRIFGLGIKFQ